MEKYLQIRMRLKLNLQGAEGPGGLLIQGYLLVPTSGEY